MSAKRQQTLSGLVRNPRHTLNLLRAFVQGLPYRLGITSVWPGSFIGWIPDRYSAHARKAVARSGLAQFKSTAGFLHRNKANNAGDLTRFYLFNLIFEQIVKEGMEGDLAELGVYKGNTAVLLADFARAKGRKTYLFDTFQGFSRDDMRGIDAGRDMEFEDTSIAGVRSLVGSDNVEYVVGYFPDSASALPGDLSFCMAHLDCDLYAPMKAGLEYFYPRLVSGGFLVLHDYSSMYWDGVERSIDEFLAGRRERLVPIPDKSGTAVIRKL